MYKASIENRGDTRSYATTRHASFVLDTSGNGANPIDTLLASLCSCMGHYVRDYLLDQPIGQSGFSVHAAAGVASDEASLAEIQVRIDLGKMKLDGEQTTALLKFVENCKVHKILKENPGVRVTIAGQRPQ
jgi:uncharacterized OsmC-like protein